MKNDKTEKLQRSIYS